MWYTVTFLVTDADSPQHTPLSLLTYADLTLVLLLVTFAKVTLHLCSIRLVYKMDRDLRSQFSASSLKHFSSKLAHHKNFAKTNMANTNIKIFNPCLKFRSMQKACRFYFPWTLSILDSIVCLDFSPKDYRKDIVLIFLAKVIHIWIYDQSQILSFVRKSHKNIFLE